jgi:hypothetical protein
LAIGFDVILIQHINVYINVAPPAVSIDFDIFNPLPTNLTILFLQSDASVNGTTYAHVDHAFNPGFVVPANSSANSGKIPNVLLLKNFHDTSAIIDKPLDIASAITNQ